MVRIAVIPGDGIANEVVPEAVKTLEAVNALFEFGLEYETFDYGVERYLRTGEVAPDDIDDIIKRLPEKFDAALFGAGGIDPRLPAGTNAQVVLRGLRRGLDLFANVRPCRLLDPSLTPLKNKTSDDIDFVVIRENTEGYEGGTAGNFKRGTPDETEIRPEYNTYKGVKRVLEFAFDYAKKTGRSRVHMAEKGMPGGLWSRLFKGSTALSRALRLLGLPSISACDGLTTRRDTSRNVAVWPQSHIGRSGGQMQSVASRRNRFLTILSSREW